MTIWHWYPTISYYFQIDRAVKGFKSLKILWIKNLCRVKVAYCIIWKTSKRPLRLSCLTISMSFPLLSITITSMVTLYGKHFIKMFHKSKAGLLGHPSDIRPYKTRPVTSLLTWKLSEIVLFSSPKLKKSFQTEIKIYLADNKSKSFLSTRTHFTNSIVIQSDFLP